MMQGYVRVVLCVEQLRQALGWQDNFIGIKKEPKRGGKRREEGGGGAGIQYYQSNIYDEPH